MQCSAMLEISRKYLALLYFYHAGAEYIAGIANGPTSRGVQGGGKLRGGLAGQPKILHRKKFHFLRLIEEYIISLDPPTPAPTPASHPSPGDPYPMGPVPREPCPMGP